MKLEKFIKDKRLLEVKGKYVFATASGNVIFRTKYLPEEVLSMIIYNKLNRLLIEIYE